MIPAVALVHGRRKLQRKAGPVRAVAVAGALFALVVAGGIVGVAVYESSDDLAPGQLSAQLDPTDLGLMGTLAARMDVPVRALAGVLLVDRMTVARVGCAVPWWVLLGVAHVESGAGTHGGAHIDADWVVRPLIGGLPLDGNGVAPIFELGVPDRAQGPFQFISSSWRAYGLDADGDGVADPHSFLDGALGAANHLCRSAGGPGADLSEEAAARRGFYGYNRSLSYVEDVWAAALGYRVAGTAFESVPGDLGVGVEPAGPFGQLVDVGPCVRAAGCRLDASWASNLLGVLAACRAQGHDIVIVSADRTYAEQVGLYAAYLNGSGGLAARPGSSNHEGGRAVDLAHASGGGLSGPGDRAWECMKAYGPRFGVYQSPDITSRDSVHFSATGN